MFSPISANTEELEALQQKICQELNEKDPVIDLVETLVAKDAKEMEVTDIDANSKTSEPKYKRKKITKHEEDNYTTKDTTEPKRKKVEKKQADTEVNICKAGFNLVLKNCSAGSTRIISAATITTPALSTFPAITTPSTICTANTT